MELVQGATLAERLTKGALKLEETQRIALQMAEALEVAHEKRIVHRDLKPANVKVTPEGKVKVLDFGLARAWAGEEVGVDLSEAATVTQSWTETGMIIGTPAYMSPEQSRGRKVDKETDIWAFGCVVYELLTGKSPFGRETATDTVAAILKEEPEWDKLPPHDTRECAPPAATVPGKGGALPAAGYWRCADRVRRHARRTRDRPGLRHQV
jgi:serine/threonine-protein kinase